MKTKAQEEAKTPAVNEETAPEAFLFSLRFPQPLWAAVSVPLKGLLSRGYRDIRARHSRLCFGSIQFWASDFLWAPCMGRYLLHWDLNYGPLL